MNMRIFAILTLLCVGLTIQEVVSQYARDFATGFFPNVKGGAALKDNCLGAELEFDMVRVIQAIYDENHFILGIIVLKISKDIAANCPKAEATKIVSDVMSKVNSGEIFQKITYSAEFTTFLRSLITTTTLTSLHAGQTLAKIVNMIIYDLSDVKLSFLQE